MKCLFEQSTPSIRAIPLSLVVDVVENRDRIEHIDKRSEQAVNVLFFYVFV